MCMLIKTKKCKVCKAEFYPSNSTQKVCQYKCAIELIRMEEKKKFKAVTRKMKKEMNDGDKKFQADLTKSLCHKYIRLRDKNIPCISCGTTNAKWDAGHYMPSFNNPAIRYHPFNINKQCYRCNQQLSANLTSYRKNLIEKIGLKNVEWLETQKHSYKYTLEDHKEMQEYFKELIRQLSNWFDDWMEGLE